MRPKPPHAAESGVGKHKARESEAPNIVPSGKSAWRTPTPKFGPGTARFRGLIVFGGMGSLWEGFMPRLNANTSRRGVKPLPQFRSR